MKTSIIYIFLSTVVALTRGKDECCEPGINKAVSVFLNDDVTCDADDTIGQNQKNDLKKLVCRRMYQQCCISSAKSNYCMMGKTIGRTEQLCLKGSHPLAGEAQMICCDCCKTGRKVGTERGDCKKRVGDELCNHAYSECCMKVKNELPKEPTTKPKTTCSDVTCDTKSTEGCTESSKGAQCICKQGYHARNDGITCVDINECKRDKTICPKTCINLPGSYKCSCDKGYKYMNKKCVKVKTAEVQCDSGYEYKDDKCVDINECITGAHRCPTDSFCMNNNGAYRCLNRCPFPEYEQPYHQGKRICQDVDECAKGTHRCDKLTHECVNTIGGYNCKRVRCQNGYKLKDGYCLDIDECENDADICGVKGNCRNAWGTYYCDCQKGYTIDPKTKKCADMDECKLKRANCNYKCVNTEGSYHCSCPAGYEARGRLCYDIDECQANKCPSGTICFNTFGSYACINETCPNAFYVRTSEKECSKKECKDNKVCKAMPDYSIKWAAYRVKKTLHPNWFRFTYSLGGFNNDYTFHYAIAGGNEEGHFEVRRMSRMQAQVFNANRIDGPKDYVLTFYADALYKGVLTHRFVYKLYIYVSPYDF